MRAWLAALGIGVGGLLPTLTHAEEPPDASGDQREAEAHESAHVPPEGARGVPIHAMLLVSTDDELRAHIDLYPDGGRHDPLSVSYTPGCVNECFVMAPPGRYRVVMSDPSGGRLLERPTRIELSADTRFELRPPRVELRQRWFGVAAASSLAFAVGGVMMSAQDTAIFESDVTDVMVGTGAFLFLTSLVMTPVSWSMYAHARHPAVKARPLVGPRSR